MRDMMSLNPDILWFSGAEVCRTGPTLQAKARSGLDPTAIGTIFCEASTAWQAGFTARSLLTLISSKQANKQLSHFKLQSSSG